MKIGIVAQFVSSPVKLLIEPNSEPTKIGCNMIELRCLAKDMEIFIRTWDLNKTWGANEALRGVLRKEKTDLSNTKWGWKRQDMNLSW
jgi:hypothetical protein